MKNLLFAACVLVAQPALAASVALKCKEVDISNELWTPVAQYAFRSRPDVAFDGESSKVAELRRAKVQRFDSRFDVGPGEPPFGQHEVVVTLLVEPNGKVSDVALHKKVRHAEFNDAALAIARSAAYSPAMLREVAVASVARLSCTFDVQ